MEINVFPQDFCEIFGLPISESLLSAWIVTAALLLALGIMRIFVIPKFKMIPGAFQSFLEWIVEAVNKSASAINGKNVEFYASFALAAFSYICFGTLIEIFGLRPPIADLNTCIPLALTAYIVINFFGLRYKGLWGRLKHYLKPPVVGLFVLISDTMVPVSMTFRLFGSILSGYVIMTLITSVAPIVVPAVFTPVFTLFHALIQGYIFITLTFTFVGEAIE